MNRTSAVEVRIQAVFPSLSATASWASAWGDSRPKLPATNTPNKIRKAFMSTPCHNTFRATLSAHPRLKGVFLKTPDTTPPPLLTLWEKGRFMETRYRQRIRDTRRRLVTPRPPHWAVKDRNIKIRASSAYAVPEPENARISTPVKKGRRRDRARGGIKSLREAMN